MLSVQCTLVPSGAVLNVPKLISPSEHTFCAKWVVVILGICLTVMSNGNQGDSQPFVWAALTSIVVVKSPVCEPTAVNAGKAFPILLTTCPKLPVTVGAVGLSITPCVFICEPAPICHVYWAISPTGALVPNAIGVISLPEQNR